MTHSKTRSPRRGALRWLLITILGLFGIGLIAVALTVGYVYQHPSSLKTFAAEQLQHLAGVAVTIGELSYGVDPFHLRVRDIDVRLADGENKPGLQLGFLAVDAHLIGPFGRRTLIVDHLRIEDFSARVKTDVQLPIALSGSAAPSFPARLVRKLAGYLLASDIKWSSIEAENGQVAVIGEAMELVFAGLHLKSSPTVGIDARGQLLESRIGAGTVVAAADGRIHLDPPLKSAPIAGEMVLSGGRISGVPLGAENITAALRLVYQPERNDISLPEINLTGNSTFPKVAQTAAQPATLLTFSGRGAYRMADKVLEFSGWSFGATDLMEAAGSARLETAAPYRLQLALTSGRLDADRVGTWYAAVTGGQPPLTVSGPIGLAGDIKGPLTGKSAEWQGDLQLMLQSVPITYSATGARLQAEVSGSVQVNGNAADPLLQINLDADRLAITTQNAALTGFQPHLTASGHFPALDISLHTRGSGARLAAGPRQLTGVRLELDRGQIDLHSGELSLPRIAFSSSSLTNLTGSLSRSGEQVFASLRGRDSALLQTAASWGFLPAGWRFGAQDTLDLDLQWRAAGGLLNCRMAVTDLHFSDPEQRRIGEKMDGALVTSASFGGNADDVQADVNLTASAGEVLWGKHYLDLATTPFDASGRLQIKADSGLLTIERLEASLANLVAGTLSGALQSVPGGPEIDLHLDVPATHARPLYRLLVAEPFRYDQPILYEAQVGGRIRGSATMTGNRRSMRVKGRAYWQQGHVDTNAGAFSLAGIDLDLPFWYQSLPEAAAASLLTGHLKIDKMRLPYLDEQPLALDVEVGPNRLVLPKPPAFELFSGRVAVGPVIFTDLFHERARIDTHLSVTGIRIDDWLTNIWPQPIGGILSGRLAAVRLENSRLTSRGTMSVDIFGGQIQISDPGVLNPLTSVPALVFDSRIDDLNLGDMTAGTAFGKIQGILRGSVTNVEIVSGQPQKFDLRLETVPTQGVKQKINIRAVESIASLGGGGSPFAGLAGSFATFFREFSYWKIGIAAALENDVFRINGTIKQDGREYLVKKSGFSGVDVVNLNPDNRISFKDMVKRIKRISKTGGGPVIR
ncbi:MAG: hypothetical protein WAM73_20670 [Desulfobacterales bacterium]